jgi:hypothetical protein
VSGARKVSAMSFKVISYERASDSFSGIETSEKHSPKKNRAMEKIGMSTELRSKQNRGEGKEGVSPCVSYLAPFPSLLLFQTKKSNVFA